MDQITTVIIGPILSVAGDGGGSVPVVDNLLSTSTTSALSANQGRVLSELIDGIEVGTNAATLDGQMPAYYLDRANHTGNTPAANVTQDATHRFATDAEKTTWNAKQNALGFTPVNTTDPRLSDSRTPLPHSHAISDVTGLSGALSDKADSSAVATELAGKVDTIAGKGLSTNDYTTAEKNKLAGLSNYDDTGIQAAVSNLQTTKANTSDLATVAISGAYGDLSGKPRYEVLAELPADLSGYPDGSRIIIADE